MSLIYCILVTFTLFQFSSGSRVLLLPFAKGSHVSEMSIIGTELTNRGHKVFIILQINSKFKNIEKNRISLLTFQTSSTDIMMESDQYQQSTSDAIFQNNMLGMYSQTIGVTKRQCQLILQDQILLQKLKYLEFDVVLVGAFPLNYCLFLLPKLLNVPTISVFSSITHWDMGIPALPSFVPAMFQLTNDKMSLLEKIGAGIFYAVSSSSYYPFRWDVELLAKYAPEVSSWNELFMSTELFIAFRDEILERPCPKMPNTVFLPGITYKPAEKLDGNIKSIYDQAKAGVILVTFGSAISSLPHKILNKFLHAFQKFPTYQFIFRYKTNSNEDLATTKNVHIPNNVHLIDWLPQNDCLGNKKTKLYISHGGNNGQYEAVYHGVPMISFPMFADQHHNAFRIQDFGLGVTLDIHSFKVPHLEKAINNILMNETFSVNVHQRMLILHDRKHPKHEAVYWIEHVIKFGGGHLRGESMDLPWYKLLMIDIIGFIIVVVGITIYVFIKLLRLVCRKCC